MQPVTAVASLALATLPEGDFPPAAAADIPLSPNHAPAASSSSSRKSRCMNPAPATIPEGDFPAAAAPNHSEAPLGSSSSTSKNRRRNPKAAQLPG